MNLIPIFDAIGLNNEAANIYGVLLDKGSLRVAVLAKLTNIPRTTCYEYIPKLIEKGLIEVEVKEKTKLYKTTHPQNLLNLLYKQKNDVNFQLSNLENKFDDLIEAYDVLTKSSEKPTVEIKELNAEGVVGLLKSLLRLENLKLILYASGKESLSANLKPIIQKLIKKQTAIIPNNFENELKGDKNRLFINSDKMSSRLLLKIIAEDGVIWLNLEKNIVTLLRDNAIIKAESDNFDTLVQRLA